MNNADNKIHTHSNPSLKQEEIQKIIDEHITHIIEKERQEQLHPAKSHSDGDKTMSIKQRCLQMIKFRFRTKKKGLGNRDKP